MITRRLFLLASGLPFLPKFGFVKKEKPKQKNFIDPNRVYKVINFIIIYLGPLDKVDAAINKVVVEVNEFRSWKGLPPDKHRKDNSRYVVHDPTGDFFNEPAVDLVGRKGTALWTDGRWIIDSLCCSDDDMQSTQQRFFDNGIFPSFDNYKKMNKGEDK